MTVHKKREWIATFWPNRPIPAMKDLSYQGRISTDNVDGWITMVLILLLIYNDKRKVTIHIVDTFKATDKLCQTYSRGSCLSIGNMGSI